MLRALDAWSVQKPTLPYGVISRPLLNISLFSCNSPHIRICTKWWSRRLPNTNTLEKTLDHASAVTVLTSSWMQAIVAKHPHEKKRIRANCLFVCLSVCYWYCNKLKKGWIIVCAPHHDIFEKIDNRPENILFSLSVDRLRLECRSNQTISRKYWSQPTSDRYRTHTCIFVWAIYTLPASRVYRHKECTIDDWYNRWIVIYICALFFMTGYI